MGNEKKEIVPKERVRVLVDRAPNSEGDYILYWMTGARRTTWNYALDRALELASELGKPLLVLEAIRLDYRWASDRFHRFVLQGMAENQRRFSAHQVAYYPFVETQVGEGKGLLRALADSACVVVTDDAPVFFLPALLRGAVSRLRTRLEAVDSNGLLPMREAPKAFARAYDFRRFLQKSLGPWLSQSPCEDALSRLPTRPLVSLPAACTKRWPPATSALLEAGPLALGRLPLEHSVGPVKYAGGSTTAEQRLEGFLNAGFGHYAEGRNRLSSGDSSGLSGYLHFGHISAHEIFRKLAQREAWSPDMLGECTKGKREGWWGMGENSEAFLDQLVTWRELGFNNAVLGANSSSYSSIPEWARVSLELHSGDARPYRYDLATLEQAGTHDDLWNAAQEQLRQQGTIHNYLRMLWGKKILHWSRSPEEAFEIMVELNNKYAMDGRDPNSDSGILWTLGKFDRAWGPERPVFGKVRYMTSENTRKKLGVGPYIAEWLGPRLDSLLP